jgi:protein-disulfide isomerase
MKNARNIALSIISSALLAGAAWALPASPAGHQSGAQSQAAQLQSASGKITAVSSSSFTLKTVASNPPSHGVAVQSQDPNQSKDQGKEMTFTIDQNTTVDGKLAVGANADVSYRTDANGNNVAVTVHVTPQS